MEEKLELDGILDDDGMLAFTDADLKGLVDTSESTSEESEDSTEEENKETENDKATEDQLREVFKDSESVGSEEEIEDTGSASPSESNSSSPKADFFSSIAEAFAEEGILPDLDKEDIKKIKTAEDFRNVITDYIHSELTEQQQRVVQALDAGVGGNVIQQYETLLYNLNNISEEALSQETEAAENARKNFIYQDFINRGFSKERAIKEVEKSLQNGTDIEDALDALKSNIEYYTNSYNGILHQAEAKRQSENNRVIERTKNLKKTLFDDSKVFFGDIDLDKNTKQKIFDNIVKPVSRDPDSGEYLTAIQKYERDNPDDFAAKLGLLYTLTDGFKSLDKLVNTKVKKGVKKGLANLESVLNNTSRDTFGNLNFLANDDNSYIGKGLKIDI